MDMSGKDIKHFIGNPLFAIETNIHSLRRRIPVESHEILDEIQVSIEKIKDFINTFEEQIKDTEDNG